MFFVVQSVLYVEGKYAVGIGVRCQWVKHHYRSKQRTIFTITRDLAYIVFFCLVSCTNLKPALNFVFRVDGSSESLIGISIAFYNTVVV